MDSRSKILQYVQAARRNPVSAGDPKVLDSLEASALNDFTEGFVSLTAPNSPYTWEVRAILPGNALDSGRVPFAFPWAVDIAGLRPVVVPIRPIGAGLIAPTADDLDVQIDINQETQITTGQGISTIGAQGGNNFVTLSSVGVQVPRVLGLRLKGARPTVGFTFRWKQPSPAAPIFSDCIVAVAIYAYKWSGEETANAGSGLR